MTVEEMKKFGRNHFEQFVNRKNIAIGDVNFGPQFCRPWRRRSSWAAFRTGGRETIRAALKRTPDVHVTSEDIMAPGDKVIVRNTWAGRGRETGQKIRFSGIVIRRIEDRELVERCAYLEPPKPA